MVQPWAAKMSIRPAADRAAPPIHARVTPLGSWIGQGRTGDLQVVPQQTNLKSRAGTTCRSPVRPWPIQLPNGVTLA